MTPKVTGFPSETQGVAGTAELLQIEEVVMEVTRLMVADWETPPNVAVRVAF